MAARRDSSTIARKYATTPEECERAIDELRASIGWLAKACDCAMRWSLEFHQHPAWARRELMRYYSRADRKNPFIGTLAERTLAAIGSEAIKKADDQRADSLTRAERHKLSRDNYERGMRRGEELERWRIIQEAIKAYNAGRIVDWLKYEADEQDRKRNRKTAEHIEENVIRFPG
jgi:hypothetical protein